MDLTEFDNTALISMRIAIEQEMQSRGISFSVGELGEKLAIEYFASTPGLSNLMAAPTGSKNIDALSRDGERYSIKSILKAKKTGTIYPDSEDRDKQLFEYLLLVILSPDYSLSSMYRMPWAQFIEVRAWDKRMNAWYVPVSKSRLDGIECLYDSHRPG